MPINDNLWNSEDILYRVIKVLDSTGSASLDRIEKLGDSTCYVVNIMPSIGLLGEWADYFGAGVNALAVSSISSLAGRNNFIKSYKKGKFIFWIDESNYHILKIDFQAYFEALPDDLIVNPSQQPPINLDKISIDFGVHGTFADYGQKMDMQIPREILDAQEYNP